MRVAITGATGFIGWHAARTLREAGHEVRALVRDGGRARKILAPLGLDDADLVVGDMAVPADAVQLLDGCDAAVHSAAAVSVTDPKLGKSAFEANLRGVENILGGARSRGVDPILYVSSSIVLFEPGRSTTTESPVNPGRTHYGRSKAQSEYFARALQDAGAPIGIVYPTGVVGPDDPGFSESVKAYRGFLRTTIQTSGGNQFVDARDLALLICRMLETRTRGRVIAGGHYFDWDSFTALIEDVAGVTLNRLRAPGWALRGGGRLFDAIASLSGRRFPISGEGMEVATRMMPAIDSPEVKMLGVDWRPARETLADLFRWYHATERIPARAIPALLEAVGAAAPQRADA